MKYAGKKVGIMPASTDSQAPTKPDTTKKTGTFKGKSNAVGGGGRFSQLQAKGMSGGLASFIGRKKFGNKAFAQMASAGKSAK